MLEALAYSHQHGIVHRDIKPANVIITDAGAVKVMDFGIARALHGASTTMTQTGMVMGTPQYLSPEQALGKAVDHRSDLYATGCLLYELLALRPPFVGETPLSVVYQHVQDEPKVPSRTSDRVPPELDGLVLRALAKNPDDRYQSAEEMHGLVQYSLRMLREQGGWTGGAWDTGYAGAGGHATPPGGTSAATTALPRQQGGHHTAEFGAPLLLGRPGDPEGDGGYGYPDEGRRSHRGRNTVLVVIAALVAIGLGVFFAVNAGHDHNKHKEQPGGASPSVTDGATTPGAPTGTTSETGGQTSDFPSNSPSSVPSRTATSAPPTSAPPTTPPPATTPPPTTPPPTTPPPTTTGGATGGSTAGTAGTTSGQDGGSTNGITGALTDGGTGG